MCEVKKCINKIPINWELLRSNSLLESTKDSSNKYVANITESF